MKWYEDMREELTVLSLAGIAIVALVLQQGEIAAGAAGGLAGYLKGRAVKANPQEPS